MTTSTPDQVSNGVEAPKLPCPKCGTKLRLETLLGTSRDLTECIPVALADIQGRINHWRHHVPDSPMQQSVIGNLEFALSRVEDIRDALKFTTVRWIDADAARQEPE